MEVSGEPEQSNRALIQKLRFESLRTKFSIEMAGNSNEFRFIPPI